MNAATPSQPLTVIVGMGNAVSTLAAPTLRKRGLDVLELGLTAGTHESATFLDVTDEAGWAALKQDDRLRRPAYFLYTVGHGDPSVLALSGGSSIGQHTAVNLQGLQNFFAFLARREVHSERTSSVVLVTSLNSRLAVPGYSGYCATKAGAAMLARVAAIELAPFYRINMVAPGPFCRKTSESHGDLPLPNESLAKRHILGGRLTTAIDVWRVVEFLLSDASSWMTGCELPVDGGLHLLGASY